MQMRYADTIETRSDGIRARVHLDRARIQAIYQKKAIRQAERDPISAPRCTCIQVFRVPASRATR